MAANASRAGTTVTTTGAVDQAAMVKATGESELKMQLVCMGVGMIGWMMVIIQSMRSCPRRSPAIICQCMKSHLRSQRKCHQSCFDREFVKSVMELLSQLSHVIVLVNLIM